MRILFFDTKSYDRASFDKQLEHYPGIEIDYLKTDLAPKQRLWQKVLTLCVLL